MAPQIQCFDDVSTIHRGEFCLNALSKNFEGKLIRTTADEHKCAEPECKTFTAVHRLLVKPRVNQPCDSRLARPFGGTLEVARLVSALDQDGQHRGFHTGDFTWTGTGGVVVKGRMSGMTNVGTHRQPVFKDCQPCDARGVMEGRLCGPVVSAEDPALKGCHVIAAYRIKFDPSAHFQNTAISGVIEGVIICPCRKLP